MGDVIDKQIEKELRSCEKCGENRGFHVCFKRDEGDCQIILICPNCDQRYSVGWTFS